MKYFDRVVVTTATTGTGTVTLGSALDTNFFTFAEQGAADSDQVYYMINEGGDVEIGIGTLGGTVSTLSRDAVLSSRVAGTAGTSKKNLAGSAQVRCISPSDAISAFVRHDIAQSLTVAQQYQARTNIGAGFGFENKLINPLFQVDIEGNAGGTTASGQHIVEGWAFAHSSDVTTLTASRVAGDSVPYALRMTVTTGSDASIAADQYASFASAIEGYDISDAKWGTADAKPVWISGRIKAPTTGTYCVRLCNASYSRSYVFEVACTAGTLVDFEKEVPGDTSGTWGNTTGAGVIVSCVSACGTTYQTTADTWAAGNYLATANQANGLATNGNIYEIEDIRVSVGKPIKTEWRPYALDLLHCQRYYETGNGVCDAGQYAFSPFKASMRAAPSVVVTPTAGSPSGITTYADGLYVSISLLSAYAWTANARMI